MGGHPGQAQHPRKGLRTPSMGSALRPAASPSPPVAPSPCHVSPCQGNGVFGHGSFASRGVSSHQQRLPPLQAQRRTLLEGVRAERPLQEGG